MRDSVEIFLIYGLTESKKCLVNIWSTCTSACGQTEIYKRLALFLDIPSTFSDFLLQIQFREKVLWTAITLFIFLVCCQVGKVIFI